MDDKRVAVIVLNYCGWQDTIECLESIKKICDHNFLTIVIDNGSSNDSAERIKAWAAGNLKTTSQYFEFSSNKPIYVVEYLREEAEKGGIGEKEGELKKFASNEKLVLIKNRENLGYSAGNNVGAKYAMQNGFDYVVFLNNDTVIIDRHFFPTLIAPFKHDEKIYAVGPKIIDTEGNFDGPYIFETFWGEVLGLTVRNQARKLMGRPPIYIDMAAVQASQPTQVYKVSGACIAFRASFLERIGYLDENVWLSCEEAIIAEQVLTLGGKIFYQPLTVLIHKRARSPRKDKSKIDILRNHFRQREYFLKTYKGYGHIRMSLIKFTHRARLFFERIRN